MRILLKQLLSGIILLGACSTKHDAQNRTRLVAYPMHAPAGQPLVYQTYGLPELYHDQALRYVLQRFGVEVKSVAGCVVTDSLVANVAKNNEALFAAISKRFGNDAQMQILDEVNSRAATQQKLEARLRREPSVSKKERWLKSKPEEGSIIFGAFEESGTDRFQIQANVLRYKNGDWQRGPWKLFSIDTQRNIVRTVD